MKNYLLLFCFTVILTSCNTTKKEGNPTAFETETIRLDSTNLTACKDSHCPEVLVQYEKIKGNSDFSKSINAKTSAELIRLFDNVEDMDSPNKTVEEAVNGFVNDYFEFKRDYPESVAEYEASIEQKILDQNDQTLVFKTSFYLFTGGAHGYGGVRFLNFDAETGKLLSHAELISDIPAFTDFVEERFRKKYNIPPETNINSQGFFFDDGKFVLPENIAVTSDSVILLYNPYEAASYAQGQLRFVFPKKAVKQWMKY